MEVQGDLLIYVKVQFLSPLSPSHSRVLGISGLTKHAHNENATRIVRRFIQRRYN